MPQNNTFVLFFDNIVTFNLTHSFFPLIVNLSLHKCQEFLNCSNLNVDVERMTVLGTVVNISMKQAGAELCQAQHSSS